MTVTGTSSRERRFCVSGHDTAIVGRRADGWCRECAREKKRAWHAANIERAQAYSAAYYADHADELREINRAKARVWAAENPEKKRAADAAYAKANPEVRQTARRRWRQRNPEAVSRAARIGKYKRRAILRQVERAPYDYRAVVYGAAACGICQTPYEPGADRVLDHIVPITKGGADAPWNVQSAHRLCNSRKGNRA